MESVAAHNYDYRPPPIHRLTRLRPAPLFDNQNFYANNVLVHTQAATGAIGDTLPGQNELRAGGRQAVGQHFQGRIDEVRVYGSALAASEVAELAVASGNIRWLVTDHLGTPRMVVDLSGELDKIKRHDYLPFGEELFAGTGGRTTNQGYSQPNTLNTLRERWATYERDDETGLNYAQARYYSSAQGRFTSPDEFKSGPRELWVLGSGDPEKQALYYAEVTNPQSLNKYQYCFNNPLRYVDPDGQNPQDSFEIRMQQSIREVNSGRLTQAQYWDRLRGASIGAGAGLATILAAKGGAAFLSGALLWGSRNPAVVQQVAQEFVQASSGNPTTANLGTPLTSIFNVDKNVLTSGKFLIGSTGRGADVAGQFTKNGDTLVAGLVGVFNKTEGLTGSTLKSLLNSVKDFARQEGLAKVEVQAIAVINSDLEKLLLKRGFQRTTVMVEGNKTDALTKTITVR